ncbi:SDR family NAD(P)-dependent oxidoreductase [Luteococcus sediminum]
MATALVTGGTSGIGNAFVRALAARGDDVVVVARDTERMTALAAEMEKIHGVTVTCLTADLSLAEDVTRIADWIEDPAHPLDLVVNNAGFGLHAKILDKEALPTQRRAMDLMTFAVLELSAAAGRAMKARGHGHIINVSSTSAWIFSGNYSAIKAWVRSFTVALAIELEGTGVTATALCPGWVHTEFHQRAGASTDNLPGFVWVDPDVLVREALADAEKGRTISIPTAKWKAAIFLASLPVAPPVVRLLSGRLARSRHKK